MTDSCTVVIDGITNVDTLKPDLLRAWLAPHGAIKCLSIYEKLVFAELENATVAKNVIKSENGSMFRKDYVSVRYPLPWDMMVTGYFVTKREWTSQVSEEEINNEANSEAESSNEKASSEVDAKELLAQVKYLDMDELCNLYTTLQDIFNKEEKRKKKAKSLPSGRPWLDDEAKRLFAIRNEALKKLEKEDNKENLERFFLCETLYIKARNRCQKAWMHKINQEIDSLRKLQKDHSKKETDGNSLSFDEGHS